MRTCSDMTIEYSGEEGVVYNGFNALEIVSEMNIFNTNFSGIMGFQSLKTVRDNINIAGNKCSVIPDFPQLEIIENAYNAITIESNSNLLKLEGFNALICCSTIEVLNNKSLTEINGFDNLREIAFGAELGTTNRPWAFVVNRSPALVRFLGFENLERASFEIDAPLTEISDFPVLYESEDVLIANTNLTDINGFNALRDANIILNNNTRLENISGFNAYNGLTIHNFSGVTLTSNVLLKDITGFAALDTLGSFSIENCYSLETLPLVDRLQYLSTLRIENNYSLTTIPAFQPTVALRTLTVTGNTALEDYTNFRAVIDENTDVTISNNKYNPTKEDILSGAVKPEE